MRADMAKRTAPLRNTRTIGTFIFPGASSGTTMTRTKELTKTRNTNEG